MKFFDRNTQQEIDELRNEFRKLRYELSELKEESQIRVGDWNGNFFPYFYSVQDSRPIVNLRYVVLLLTEHLKLEIKQTPETPAKTVLCKVSPRKAK